MLQVEAPISHSRRIFLQGSILIPAVACSVPALALPPDSMVTEPKNRRLNLINMHTDEVLDVISVSYTHLRAHETKANLVCRLLLEKKK